MRTRGFFLTGPPGTGKTTIVMEAVRLLKREGCRVDGLTAPEVRVGGRRIGFRLCTFEGDKCWWLARIDCAGRVRVGRYIVCLDEAAKAAEHLTGAAESSDVIVVDEIGPMELKVPALREAIRSILELGKPVIGVVHRRLKTASPELYRLASSIGPIIWLSHDNRERVRLEVQRLARVLVDEVCGGERGEGTAQDTRHRAGEGAPWA